MESYATEDIEDGLKINRVVFPVYPSGSSAGAPIFDSTPCDNSYTSVWRKYELTVHETQALDSVR
jgi:hypothetical protein